MEGEKVKYEDPSLLKSFVAGVIGGIVEVTVGHPLDTVKVSYVASRLCVVHFVNNVNVLLEYFFVRFRLLFGDY